MLPKVDDIAVCRRITHGILVGPSVEVHSGNVYRNWHADCDWLIDKDQLIS